MFTHQVMKTVSLIFPHQLFADQPALANERPVYLVEESLFFNQYNFHQQKILLHRASMKAYAGLLTARGFAVHYIEAITPLAEVRRLIKELHAQQVGTIYITDVVDDWLRKRIEGAAKKYGIGVITSATPNFLNTLRGVDEYFKNKKTYFQTDFYTWQRKQRKILVDGGGRPEGGQWSFDSANRLRYPKKQEPPTIGAAGENENVREARRYVAENFSSGPGSSASFLYPVDHAAAGKWLDKFLKERFQNFGAYEDAIVAKESFLHHSVLTPMLNIGLLSPQQIISGALDAAPKYNVPLNSLEGFIRQVMGWREFIRFVYEREGHRQRTNNYWGFTRKIPASFWNASTGIEPVDNVIGKVLQTGYSHHIERLMVMGNFMLLCEFDPDEVYRWFMEMYVDAYDWVMVPNVYGMTQFADGGLMTTKPYISSSNYLLKMSDYKKGKWTETWDGLFWRFMHVHRDFFTSNPRLGMLLKTFDQWPGEKRNHHLSVAEDFLQQLDVQAPKY